MSDCGNPEWDQMREREQKEGGPIVRQILIADDDTWLSLRYMLKRQGLDVSRMPQLGDEEGIENYCLVPRISSQF